MEYPNAITTRAAFHVFGLTRKAFHLLPGHADNPQPPVFFYLPCSRYVKQALENRGTGNERQNTDCRGKEHVVGCIICSLIIHFTIFSIHLWYKVFSIIKNICFRNFYTFLHYFIN